MSSEDEGDSEGRANIQIEDMIKNFVKYALILSENRLPIKKADLTKNALNGNFKSFPKVYEKANAELLNIYGYKLVEIEKNKTYIMISKVRTTCVDELDEDERKEQALLYIVLSYIFMKNGSVTDQGLYDFLDKINVDLSEENDIFGDVKKMIQETFVKQQYLNRIKQTVEGLNEEKYNYVWGARAHAELDKKEVLESVCDLLKKPPISYATQHLSAYGEQALLTQQLDDSQMDVTM